MSRYVAWRAIHTLSLVAMGLLLAWQVAVAVPGLVGANVPGLLAAALPLFVVAGVFVSLFTLGAAGRWPDLAGVQLLGSHRWLATGMLAVACPTFGLSLYVVLEGMGFSMGIPMLLALLALPIVFALALTRIHYAVCLFFVLQPILNYLKYANTTSRLSSTSLLLPFSVLVDLLDIPGPRQFLYLSPEVLFVAVIVTGWLLGGGLKNRSAGLTRLDKFIGLFVAGSLLSALFSEDFGSPAYFLAGILIPITFYYVILNSMGTLDRMRLSFYAISIGLAITVIYSVYNYVTGVYRGLDMGEVAALRRGLIVYNANLEAPLLVMPVPIVLVLLSETKSLALRVGLLVLIAADFLAIITSGSRGSWMATIVEVVVLMLLGRDLRSTLGWVLGATTVFMLPLAGLFESIFLSRMGLLLSGTLDRTSAIRLELWQQSIYQMTQGPLFGVGLGRYGAVFPGVGGTPNACNIFLTIGVEGGAPALASAVAMAVTVVGRGFLLVRSAVEPLRRYRLACLASTIGFLIVATTSGVQFSHGQYVAPTIMWWGINALLLASPTTKRGEP